MKWYWVACVMLGLFCVISTAGFGNDVVTTGSLIREMTDINLLTYFPEPGYKLVQFSSFDRRARERLNKNWFSNSDGFGGEPIPGFMKVLKEEGADSDGEYLMAEVNGPGAIVRLWTASIKGRVKVFLDGSDVSLFDCSAEEFFRTPYSKFLSNSKVTEDLLRGSFYQRDSAYTPIPFGKSCRIVWIGKKKDIHFYHIMFRVYPEGTIVQTFTPDDIKNNEDLIIQTAEAMKSGGVFLREEGEEVTFTNTLPPKEEIVVWEDNKGPGCVNLMKLKVSENETTGRGIILRVYADGIKEPLVDTPLIDFFGSAPGINPFESLLVSVRSGGWLVSRFPMPYKESMRITLRNVSDIEKSVSGLVVNSFYEWDDEKSMYFLARWRGECGLWVQPAKPYDLPFLYAKGKGCVVGSVSYVFNPSAGPTSGGNWWGEGDEKIFVDEDLVPSIFGTGSEDFYNYSWSATDIFFYPYCGQPRNDGPGNRGFASNYRWLILDRVPFTKFIAFSLELLMHEETRDVGYARIAYYYAMPETTDDHSPIPDYEYDPLSVREEWHWIPEPRGAARGGLFYQAEDCLASFNNVSLVSSYQWAGRGLCVWKPEKGDERLVFKIFVPNTKEYEVKLVCGLMSEGGEFSVLIDDNLVREGGNVRKFSVNNTFGVISREVSIGRFKLGAGEHTISISYVGEMGKVIPIDFIWLQP